MRRRGLPGCSRTAWTRRPSAEGPAATLPKGTIADQVRLAQERLGLDRKEAMSYVARERGISRREVYASLLAEKELKD